MIFRNEKQANSNRRSKCIEENFLIGKTLLSCSHRISFTVPECKKKAAILQKIAHTYHRKQSVAKREVHNNIKKTSVVIVLNDARELHVGIQNCLSTCYDGNNKTMHLLLFKKC